MKSNEFVQYIIEDQLASVHGMSARAMFGGHGIYKEGTIVGIVIDGELYLKVDETNKAKYEAMGSAPFSYEGKNGKRVSMSYYKIPSEILEDSSALISLVDESYEINLQKGLKQKKPKKKR